MSAEPDGDGAAPVSGVEATVAHVEPEASGLARTATLSPEDSEAALLRRRADTGPLLGPGLRIEQYELIRELGRGGMGQVHLARDTKLGRKVAIKFVHRRSAAFTERFLVEAQATARCSHENIVQIFEVGEYQGHPFMVLEYLEGETLRDVVRDRRLPPARAVELLMPVVRALARAHASGIMHRDLKPENVLVQRSGTIKVLDFGLAKAVAGPADDEASDRGDDGSDDGARRTDGLTHHGAIMGTLTYMAPEQWGTDAVDHRCDIWAVGVMLHEMVAGANPLAGRSIEELRVGAGQLDRALPSVGESVPELPGHLERVIDRCLAKRKEERFGSAQELLEALEPLLPSRHRAGRFSEEQGPYPGLTAFQESDAGRFFGRTADVARAVARLADQPLVAVLGASGVGKSSFVRAGVIPALKASGEPWEAFVVRPGRNPLLALAELLAPLSGTSHGGSGARETPELLRQRLAGEPGHLGELLRARARRKQSSVLLFVDQFEELYTQVPDVEARTAYTRALAAAADDPSSPVRVVLSVRSDFVDRAAEDRRFIDELTLGLVFLQAPDRPELREALVRPLDLVGHAFESDALVEEMLDALEQTHGALPLLQFTGSRLWEDRDTRQRILTRASYESMGGVAGALAGHASEALAALDPRARELVRELMIRLVTPDGTRALVDLADLAELSDDPDEVRRVVDYLVQARLLVVQTRTEEESDGGAVELVHESLIERWPALRRWRDETRDDAAVLDQLTHAARQWDARRRPHGLLWRGEAMEEALRWQRRYRGRLLPREQEFLDAVGALATRSARLRRRATIGTIVVLLGLVAAAAVALVRIRTAEQAAVRQATVAEQEADRALAAEAETKRQIERLRAEEAKRRQAEEEAKRREEEVATGKRALETTQTQLDMSYEKLQEALALARRAKRKAEEASANATLEAERAREAATAERRARATAESLLVKERKRVERLEKERGKIVEELR